MRNVYSVAQVNAYIRNMFTQDFMLNRIYVKGEVSNCKYHTSGHIYFSLKDESGALTCVMFAGNRRGLSFPMKNGQSVIVLGTVSVYERDGKYQLYAKEILPDGMGQLYERFRMLKEELEEMGMFAPEYKQPIPAFSKRVGIVTAPTGAAIRDIMNISYRRNPYVELILYPALVQGEGAAASIVKGIQLLDGAGVDVIIIGRGGGSIEDLWAFNEESVARAVFDCSTPVISAVGHETDFTIADYVADLRAPTPSAAAELAVADVQEIVMKLSGKRQQMLRAMKNRIDYQRMRLSRQAVKLERAGWQNRLKEQNLLLMEKEDKMQQLMTHILERKRHQLTLYIEKMKSASPLDRLSQGYAYVSDEKGSKVTSVEHIQEGESLKVYVSDGVITARVTDKKKLERKITEDRTYAAKETGRSRRNDPGTGL